jgi:hypothetical protein
VRVAMAFDGTGLLTDKAIEHHGPRLVERIPCGRWTGVCSVLLPGGDVRRIERSIESRGECNSGSQL